MRASETRDFGGSRIAVSRTRKPVQLDRSDWLFEPFGKVLGSRVEHSELPNSEVRKRRMDDSGGRLVTAVLQGLVTGL